ncbi:hypothetical protein ACIBLA_05400 [Streptomyces sp. NPDC050433]|uniref:hypothetical protein n=1 Tax=Streptomyces sp. NPDC050433 TaxID=3365615 RepID=UPI00379784A8
MVEELAVDRDDTRHQRVHGFGEGEGQGAAELPVEHEEASLGVVDVDLQHRVVRQESGRVLRASRDCRQRVHQAQVSFHVAGAELIGLGSPSFLARTARSFGNSVSPAL